MSEQTSLQPWQVLNSTAVHTTPWMEVVADDCLAGNRKLTYTYTRRVDEGPMIIAEDNDHKLWLVRQYRHPIKKIIWQFPAEGKYPGESWEQAAQRGLQEELHMTAVAWVDLGQFYVDPGGLDQRYHLFLARHLTKIADLASHHEEEVEDLEIQSFSRAEIDELIATGELCDNWTLASLFIYDRYQKVM